MAPDETTLVRERYARRTDAQGERYHPFRADVNLTLQERQRAMLALLRDRLTLPTADARVLEIGCGSGSNLLELLLLGFRPANLAGVELLEARAAIARERLPSTVRVEVGDATRFDAPPASFDIVMQSTVFSSILDRATSAALAARMWDLVAPGGGILWYDFAFDNPANRDVRGVPVAEVRRLFPSGTMTVKRVTLAPPIARRAVAIHPVLYPVLNAFPFLRSHRLCWIQKS